MNVSKVGKILIGLGLSSQSFGETPVNANVSMEANPISTFSIIESLKGLIGLSEIDELNTFESAIGSQDLRKIEGKPSVNVQSSFTGGGPGTGMVIER